MSDVGSLFGDLMLDTVTVLRPSTTRTIYGTETGLVEQGTYPCRFLDGVDLVRDGTDNMAVASVAWVASAVPLSTSMLVRVNGEVLPIEGVVNYPDEVGHSHTKIMFGRR